MLDRVAALQRLASTDRPFDVLVIGGGATGVGCAIDAAARGYSTLLLEQSDFGKGTSSRSTKLAHGGVRYLQHGDLHLVFEALRERGLMRRNAPHLVRDQPFIVPAYTWWEHPFYGAGLRLYDLMAGSLGFGKSHNLSKSHTLELLPTIEPAGLKGGIIYHDGQFDDARLLVNMVQTAAGQGATLLNYCRVTALLKQDGQIRGALAEDAETGHCYECPARVVLNATGVFADSIRTLDNPAAPPLLRPSQGIHLVLPRGFLPGESAIMVPHTADGRVMFAVPWHGRVLLGTTDTPVGDPSLEPRALPEEIDFLLAHAARYLARDPSSADVLSVFAGLRPLVGVGQALGTAALSRDHTVSISGAGLVTITGGKWTTYRKMAEDAVTQAALVGELPGRPCLTATLAIHGADENAALYGPLRDYGADAPALAALMRADPALAAPLHPALPLLAGQVAWAARHELARTVEDVLSRRTRCLLLDARAAREAAPRVAEILKRELNRDPRLEAFEALVPDYLPS